MTDASTTRMLSAYEEQRSSPTLFLSSFFSATSGSFHNAEAVELDIRRGEPIIAIPVPSVESGARKHESSKYTNKKYIPPVYDLEAVISAWSTSQRQAGQNPFDDPQFRVNARNGAFRILNELEDMLQRAIEVQASQIFQTGAIDLKDAANKTIFGLDFEMRGTHIITVNPVWAADGATGAPITDIDNAVQVMRRDGKQNPTDLVFGTIARQRFFKSAQVRSELDNRGLQQLANIAPSNRGEAATLLGTMVIGGYQYRLWSYDGYYIDPVTVQPTPYVADGNVLMIADRGRRDKTFGSIPMFVPPSAQAQQFLPPRMSSVEGGFDLTTNIWVTPDGKHLTMSAGTRPLLIPTAIDTHAVLTVV